MSGQKIILLCGLVALGVLAVVFLNRAPAVAELTNYPLQNNTVVAFGDSLVFGIGTKAGGGFVALLERQLKTEIVNLGVPGDTTADGLARIDLALEQRPGVVLILLGGNDFLRQVPKKTTFSNLQKIIDSIHDQGSMIVLLGVRGGILADGYYEEFSALARKNNIAHVPNVLKGVIGDPGLMADKIHPNDAGYQKIADRIYPLLVELLE